MTQTPKGIINGFIFLLKILNILENLNSIL